MARFKPYLTAQKREKAVLVGVDFGTSSWSVEDSLAELERLADTDGADVIYTMVQRLDAPVPKSMIGSGKLEELKSICKNLEADVVIFDEDLSPSQQSNIERALGTPIKVIDRSALILDIFGNHAKTKEGRLQVQLAQLQYLLPRLRGMWSHLVGEQSRGGIGSRFGQGESQLEVDRRLVRNRITALKQELKQLDNRRQVQSKARWDSGIYRVALVGYTNAGKSTLLNKLTGSEVYAKDELFATLDPTTRAYDLEEGRKITITDTVGFIQKLPTLLVESFKSTLAEVSAADLILLLVDASDVNAEKEIAAVQKILKEIQADTIAQILVWNKCDLLDTDQLAQLRLTYPKALYISAECGTGLTDLLHEIANQASLGDLTLTVCVPYDKGLYIKMIHERCQIIRESYVQKGLLATVKASKRMADMLAPYKVKDEQQ